jgi:predicted metal-dependent HD superfamily phosphohydrolase
VPEEAFRKTRGAILAHFLQRPRIYTTEHFSNCLESQARSNLRYSLERLGV